MHKKLTLILAIVFAIGAFFAYDLQQYLSIDGLKSTLVQFQSWRDAYPLLTSAGFFLLYVAVTGLSLPGAAVMTLAAGALFGLWWGLLLVSFASTIGATLAFLVSRYMLRDVVQLRFGDRLKTINDGVTKDGAFYLFTLRLVPVVPFFVINLVMGLTSLPVKTFYWVSQLGMLAGTLVYVNAGTQLGRIERMSDILSPALLGSFVLLGLFPWLAKAVLARWQKKRVYQGFDRPKQFDRNIIVLGAGAGGLVTSYIAAAVKAKVTLIEASEMGGDCLNTGCVPSKALLRSAKAVSQVKEAARFGVQSSSPEVDFQGVMQCVNDVIAAIEPHDSVERYTELGVEVKQGYGRIVDPWTVEIDEAEGTTTSLTARSIVIATGASPVVPPLPGLDDVGCLTSETLWDAMSKRTAAPKRLAILGGGPIGCELAQAFSRLGSEVTLIEMSDQLMPREDSEVASYVSEILSEDGVRVLTGHRAESAMKLDGEKQLLLSHLGGELCLVFDELICAVGRKPRVEGFGLENLGIDVGNSVETNDYLQTLFPNIYLAGDVANKGQLTHLAAHQAWYAAVNALFGRFRKFAVDDRVIPACTYLDPEVARVGLTEKEAIATGVSYEVTRYDIDDLDRAIAEGAAKGFVKVLTAPGKDRILGAVIVGEHAGDLLAEFVLAMKHGLGLNKILGTTHSYPTWAEANKYAAGEWKRAHAPEKLLAWVKRYHDWERG